MTVLVLSGEADPTTDEVVAALRRRRVEVFRADLAWFPQRLILAAELDGDRWAGALATDTRTMALADITAVWYRRPGAFTLPAGLSEAAARHAATEAKYGLGGVLESLGCLWVNHPTAEAQLARKPTQYAAAAECGFTVPATLVTNSSGAVRRFAHRVAAPIIVKPLAVTVITEPDSGTRGIYTHLLSPEDLANLDGVETTTHLFAEFITKAFEVRITAVGNQLFAAAIHAASAAARIDFRTDYDALTYEKIEVPDAIAKACRRFLAAYGLQFGTFDFAVRPSGEWVFFECNGAASQYGWIQAATGHDITGALATLLQEGTPQ